jgi:WhiB family redox-sensing transcriptional regulator
VTEIRDCLDCGSEFKGTGKGRGLCGRCYARIYKTGSLDVLFPLLDRTDPQPAGRPAWHELEVPRVDLTWQLDALCAQVDPEIFFPEKGGSTREAKATCLGCDVRAECLTYALITDQRFGIWGGLSERDRRRLKRLDGADDPEEASAA